MPVVNDVPAVIFSISKGQTPIDGGCYITIELSRENNDHLKCTSTLLRSELCTVCHMCMYVGYVYMTYVSYRWKFSNICFNYATVYKHTFFWSHTISIWIKSPKSLCSANNNKNKTCHFLKRFQLNTMIIQNSNSILS